MRIQDFVKSKVSTKAIVSSEIPKLMAGEGIVLLIPIITRL